MFIYLWKHNVNTNCFAYHTTGALALQEYLLNDKLSNNTYKYKNKILPQNRNENNKMEINNPPNPRENQSKVYIS